MCQQLLMRSLAVYITFTTTAEHLTDVRQELEQTEDMVCM